MHDPQHAPDQAVIMDLRELKALELAARSKVEWTGKVWLVPSQTTATKYTVTLTPESCQCDDYALRKLACKHIIAARLVWKRDFGGEVQTIDTDEAPKRKTYKQDWPKYNLAQQTEKDRFQDLLYELCQGIEEPPPHNKGGRRIYVRDMVFAAAFKVFSTLSGLRFACDLKDAAERGCFTRAPSAATVAYFIESEEMTDHLYKLIEQSALPLRAIETTFAPDSTGFSTSRFVRWFDEKRGGERSGRAWVKAHVMTGTKTNIITTAIVDAPHAND